MVNESDRENTNFSGLPPEVVSAALQRIAKKINPGIFAPSEEREVRLEFNLWLKSSWSIAETLGITEYDFAQWVRLGEWNLSKNAETLKLIKDCTNIAGSQGWKIKESGMTVQEAFDKSLEHGITHLLEALDTMIALKALSGK